MLKSELLGQEAQKMGYLGIIVLQMVTEGKTESKTGCSLFEISFCFIFRGPLREDLKNIYICLFKI